MYAHTDTHAHALLYTYEFARAYPQSHTHTHTYTQKKCARSHTQKRTHAHTRAHAHTHANTRRLLVKDNKRAQRRVEPLVGCILEHVGIHDLNCVGCVGEIMEGNLKACTDISESVIRYLQNKAISCRISRLPPSATPAHLY